MTDIATPLPTKADTPAKVETPLQRFRAEFFESKIATAALGVLGTHYY